MARRRRYYRRTDPVEAFLLDLLSPLLGLTALGLLGWAYLHPEELKLYGLIGLSVLIMGVILYFVFRARKRKIALNFLSDEEILAMLKGITPSQFEQKIADMFTRLGYRTEVTGGANDGGIDVIAHKDGKKYFIQCKKFMIREVTPHDVRDFLGAITNVNNLADKGFFVTTNGFTMMAEKAAEGNPKIELIDGTRLVQYYKMAYGETASERPFTPAVPMPPSPPQDARVCPQCGGKLVLRTAHQGNYAGRQFWGCSNFPNCKYIENFK